MLFEGTFVPFLLLEFYPGFFQADMARKAVRKRYLIFCWWIAWGHVRRFYGSDLLNIRFFLWIEIVATEQWVKRLKGRITPTNEIWFLWKNKIFWNFSVFSWRVFGWCCAGIICFSSFCLLEKVEIFNLHEKRWNLDGALACYLKLF